MLRKIENIYLIEKILKNFRQLCKNIRKVLVISQ